MMSSPCQTKIPFKSRKRTSVTKKARVNTENEDINSDNQNQTQITKNICANEDECLPPKKPKLNILKNEQSSKNRLQTSKKVIKPLPSREREIETLETFLIEHLETEKSGSLYISGQPGTGKTACLSYIMQLPKIKNGYKQIYVNCTMVKSARNIYNRLCKELELPTSSSTEKACLNAIEKYLTKKHKMILLMLDEIDQLDSKRQTVLYTIFEWASCESRLVLIGVANALDLTERALPRLQARSSLRPRTMHFAPYDKQQIIHIFTTILADEDKCHVFSPVAMQMLAAKIAAICGDMRRALDIGRRVIQLAKKCKFSENQSVESMMSDCEVTVELKQVLEVLNEVYGGARKIDDEVDDAFPMQQKLILCSLMLMLSKGKNKNILMGKLHDVYKKVACARNIAPLDIGEMAGACALLEAQGALRVCAGGGAGGAGRGRQLRLTWDAHELTAALRDKPLLASILEDNTCLRAAV